MNAVHSARRLAARLLVSAGSSAGAGLRWNAAARRCRAALRRSMTGTSLRRLAPGVALLALAPPVALLAKTDDFYDACEYDAIYAALLPYAECEDAEVLWRLARACYRRAKAASGDASAEHYREGLAFAWRALERDATIFSVHKWVAVLVNEVAQLDGNKERVLKSFVMKHHMEKAVELNPKDGTCWHILGMWHYNVASIPWYQRKAVALLFATPPESSTQQALEMFLKAEEAQPNSYNQNLVMIGRCYVELGAPELARPYLERARDYTRHHLTQDDRDAKQAAAELLRSL